ncbi:MAG: glycosyltransferase [Leptolyngbyaceae cyanobacterium bins.302]|nr:glycosyltransferase [Leptolyngbyaceae cyanobacterium bins.302]
MFTTEHNLLQAPTGALQIPRSPFTEQGEHPRSLEPPLPSSLRLSLIVPTYNEGGNIEKIVHLLTQLLDPVLPNDYELIVVDDNSPDGTWQIAQALIPAYPCLKVMQRQQERGLSTAVIRGWQVAQGEILGVIDGDLQHPPDTLLKLLTAMEEGADLAVASRHVVGGGVSTWSASRRFLSRGAQLLGLVILPRVVSRVSDPMSGYFLVNRRAIADVPLSPVGYKILIEVLGRGEINPIAEVGYVFNEREEGESKVTWKQYTDYLQHLLRLRIASGRLGRFSRKLNFPITTFLRFGLVGLSGLFIDMTILHLLYTVLGIGLTRSAILAAEAAIINNFFWNDVWTFRAIAKQQRGWQPMLKRFLKFNIICLMGLILKVLLLSFFFDVLHINVYVANLLAIAIVTFWNFWINLKLSWRVTQVK